MGFVWLIYGDQPLVFISLEYYTNVIYNRTMWEVEYTDEFGKWWDTLTVSAQNSVRNGEETTSRKKKRRAE